MPPLAQPCQYLSLLSGPALVPGSLKGFPAESSPQINGAWQADAGPTGLAWKVF